MPERPLTAKLRAMRPVVLLGSVFLAGCWLSDAEVRDKYGALPDTATSETDSDADTDSDTDVDTDTDEDTDTDLPTDTDTEPPGDLACVDQDLGSARGAGVASGHNSGAGDQHVAPCAAAGGADVALAWKAPSAGCWAFHTGGSSFDTVLYVLDGCSGDPLACNDDHNAETSVSGVGVHLSAGQQVVVVVDGFNAHQVGSWQLSAGEGVHITPDHDIGSVTGDFAWLGSTASADTTLDPPACPASSGRDVFLRWVAPQTAVWTFELDILGTLFDAVLSLHRQCMPDAFDCADLVSPIGGEAVTALLYAGEEVFIRVAGYDDGSGPAGGAFRLDITR